VHKSQNICQPGATALNIKTFLCVALLAALAGCSSSEVVRQVDITVGQQLIDLKKARDNGALNASEYDAQRRKLIASVQ
jgi:hypothetical protein